LTPDLVIHRFFVSREILLLWVVQPGDHLMSFGIFSVVIVSSNCSLKISSFAWVMGLQISFF